MRVTEAVWGRLASMLPGKVFSCGAQGDFGVTIAGYSAERRPFVLLEFLFGTWGGRPDKDAIDALSSLAVNYSNTPVEIVEREQPIRIEEYGFRQDSCGPGKISRRTGLGAGIPAHRRGRGCSAGPQRPPEIPPYGLRAGHRRQCRQLSAQFGQPQASLAGKIHAHLKRGECYRAELAGGGGWGDPFERVPESVLQDVLDEKVSRLVPRGTMASR
jgi:N-methylhydantoinase B